VKKRRFWQSLRFQLVLSTSLLVMAALGITQFVILGQARDTYLTAVVRDMEFMADEMLRHVDPVAAATPDQQAFAKKIGPEVDYLHQQYFAKNGMTGYAFLLRQDGETIYSKGVSSGNVNDLGEYGQKQMAKMKAVSFNGTVNYQWKNPSDPAPRDKVAVVRTLPSHPDWVLAVSAYTTDDLLVPFTQMQQRSYLLGGAVLIAAILLVLFIAIRIVRALTPLQQSMTQIAAGNLQVDLKPLAAVAHRTDELGSMAREFHQMIAGLREMLRGINTHTDGVRSSSEALSTISAQSADTTRSLAEQIASVSAGTEEQARHAGDVNRTIEQLEQTIGQIAQGSSQTAHDVSVAADMLGSMVRDLDGVSKNAAGVADGSSRVAEMARSGVKVVDDTMQGMEQIRVVVGEAGKQIQALVRASSQIGAITQAITEIADQTNLLALNAAIEAARAGEHGRGFAVVAEEVRKLAARSAKSTGEITQLVDTIRTQTEQVVHAVQAGMSEAETGALLAAQTQQFLREIVDTVEQSARDVNAIAQAAGRVQSDAERIVQAFETVGAMTEENSAATEEMSAGSMQVGKSIDRIASIAKSSATAAQQVSASSTELSASSDHVAQAARDLAAVAQDLAGQVARFRL